MSKWLQYLIILTLALVMLAGCTQASPTEESASAGDTGGATAETDTGAATDAEEPAEEPMEEPTEEPMEEPTEEADTGDMPGLRLGELASMTGAGAAFGESHHNGVLLAVEEINEAGGISCLGPIELVLEDTASDATQAVNAANKLINQQQVPVILGAVMSSNTLAVVPVTQRAQIPEVTALSSAPTITEQGSDYIFRVQITAARSAAALARYLNGAEGIENIAIINDTNEFGTNYANVIEATLEELGNPPVARETYVTGDRDFTSQLLKISEADADAVVISGHFAEAALIMQQMGELGMDVVPAGPDAVSDPHIFDLVPPGTLEGFVFSNSYINALPSDRVAEYAAKYEERYGIPSANGDALAYDSVYLIAAAAEEACSNDPAALRDALANIEYTGLTGTITFDENGDAQRDPYVIEMGADLSYTILSGG